MKDNDIYLDMLDDICAIPEDSSAVIEETAEQKDIAIVGISMQIGALQELEELWNALYSGEELTDEFPRRRETDIQPFRDYLGMHGKYGQECFLDRIDLFDTDYFHIPPKDASLLDPAQRLFLTTAKKALEDACITEKEIAGTRTGVFVGYSTGTVNYSEVLAQSNPEFADRAIPGKVNSVIASRLSYWLNLKGPAVMIDTACSSSLAAIHFAIRSILAEECEQAIAGSIRINLLPLIDERGEAVSVTSRDFRTRTFDLDASGTNSGEGVAAIILKPLERAIKERDHIYAVIKGSALNQDGTSVGITAPNAESQENVIVQAWNNAGIFPEQISYIEAHGTATKLGDPVEVTAIEKAFNRFTDKKQFCAIGSIKANIGHLDCAAGIFGLIKGVLQIQHKWLLPQIQFYRPNKDIDFIQSAVYVNDVGRVWESEGPRIMGVSSFGMSGTNCHMIVSEFIQEKDKRPCLPMVLPISAKNEEDLLAIATQLSAWMAKDDQRTEDCIYAQAVGRNDYAVRAAVVVQTEDDILKLPHSVRSVMKKAAAKRDEERSQAINTAVNALIAGDGWSMERLDFLCQQYCDGAEVPWKQLYQELPVQKTTIPGYPLKPISCWQTPILREEIQVNTIGEQLVDRCLTESPKLYVFETVMSAETHTEVREHRIGEKNVLAGTVYVEILYNAAKHALGPDNIQIKELVFINAMVFEPDEIKQVQTILYAKSDEQFEATVQSRNKNDGTWSVNAQAVVSVFAGEQPEKIQVQDVFKRMKRIPIENDLSPVDKLVAVGPRWNVETGLWIGENEVASESVFPKEFSNELDRYAYYPSMLDASVNCSSVLNGGVLCLPYYYGTLKLYQKIPERVYSLSKKKNISADGDDIHLFDIVLFDQDGAVIATVDDYAMKKISDNQKKQFYNWEAPALHSVSLVPRDERKRTGFKKGKEGDTSILLVHFIDDYDRNLYGELRQSYLNHIHELVFCDWEAEDSRDKKFAAATDLEKICRCMEGEEDFGVEHIVIMLPERRLFHDTEELNKGIENTLRMLFNITFSIASNKKLGTLKITIVGRTDIFHRDPLSMAVEGMAKSLRNEYNRLSFHCVFYSGKTESKKIVSELRAGSDSFSVYIDNKTCYLPEISACEDDSANSQENAFKLKKGGTYVITGGLGGIGLSIAELFADMEPQIKLVLVSRRKAIAPGLDGKASASLAQRLEALREKAAEVVIESCDVSNWSAVQEFTGKYDHINGFVHAAGLAGGGFVIKQTWDKVMRVLAPKINGTWNLLQIAKKYQPEFAVLFSSYSTVLPVSGQADYISANAFVDSMVFQNEFGFPIKVINWSGWSECGMAYDNGVDMKNSPVAFLSNAEGKALFVKAMERSEPRVLAGKFNIAALAELYDDYCKVFGFPGYVKEAIRTRPAKKQKNGDVSITVLGKDSPLTPTESKVSKAWAKVLGLKEVYYTDKFLEIGGDSLSATYLQRELDSIFPGVMDITDVFAHSSIEQMSVFIDQSTNTGEEADKTALEAETEEVTNIGMKLQEEERKGSVPGGDLSAMLQMLAEGKIDTKEAGKYI